MIHSMTGYGRTSDTYGEKTVTVEIRSVNSKTLDLRMKLPNNYKDRESIFRRMVQEKADRGKIDVLVEVVSPYGEEQYSLNKLLFKKYFEELSEVARELSSPPGDIMPAILRIPNVLQVQDEDQDPNEWEVIERVFNHAMEAFLLYREHEGESLDAELRLRVERIQQLLQEVQPFEEGRIPALREKLQQILNLQLQPDQVDKNRFEQELIFYLEKYDITEEKVRLEQHCKYFLDDLMNPQVSKGRKLNFISQEMGREINTLGSKANQSDIQRLVVQMKDELEKIKEQLANIV